MSFFLSKYQLRSPPLPPHRFTLSYKCGGKVLHEEIVVSQQHASDEWGGFMLAKQSARSFRSLQDLLVYYEHDGKDLECPLNVSQLHLTREPLAEGEGEQRARSTTFDRTAKLR